MAKKNPILSNDLKKGRIIRSVGSSHRVLTPDGERVDCVVRGKFRIKGLKTTNPVAVGDEVRFSPPDEGQEMGVIYELLPRANYILRKAIGQNHKVHILAANLDQAILIFTIDYPATSTGFANRFLLVAEAYHIPAKIVINKVDLLQTEEQQNRLKEVIGIYEGIGYEVITVNSLDPTHSQRAFNLLKDKVTFIGGHSGVGKSTFINMVDPKLDIKTGNISDYNLKGRHTTTYAEMHPLSVGGFIIDSPGIKELGMVDLDKSEVSHYFPEMLERLPDCRFSNCTHVNEPGCAVKAALETGEIHPSRYDTYLRILEEIGEKEY